MSNLDDFKVEELEQRLEMGRWSLSVGFSGDSSGAKLSISAIFRA